MMKQAPYHNDNRYKPLDDPVIHTPTPGVKTRLFIMIITRLIMVIIVCIILSIIPSSVNQSNWISFGGNLYNDRFQKHTVFSKKEYLPFRSSNVDAEGELVSSVKTPSRHEFVWSTNEWGVTSNPAIKNGRVFYASYNGDIACFKEYNLELVWSINICKDVYQLNDTFCDYQVTYRAEYVSITTPSIWDDSHIVVSVRQPADILVLNSHNGKLIYKATLDDNPKAQLSQSGTIHGDSLYIGTSVSYMNSYYYDCTFNSRFYRWDLKEMRAVWSKQFNGGDYSGFTGLSILGSSPPISLDHNVVLVSVGSPICTPDWFSECISDVYGEMSFTDDVKVKYKNVNRNCFETEETKHVLFNSVVALHLNTGETVWSKKIVGYDAWAMACGELEEEDQQQGGSIFTKNHTLNCPSMMRSWVNGRVNNDFVSDPVIKRNDGHLVFYVPQNSGIIYAFKVIKKSSSLYEIRTLWATSVTSNTYSLSPLAASKDKIHFSIGPSSEDYDEFQWKYYNSTTLTPCGGWGSLYKKTGIPAWYKIHPHHCSNVYSPPVVTNDLVIVTTTFKKTPFPSISYYSPYTLVLDSKHNGDILIESEHNASEMEGGSLIGYNEYFWEYHGVSLSKDCIHYGSSGKYIANWCVSKK